MRSGGVSFGPQGDHDVRLRPSGISPKRGQNRTWLSDSFLKRGFLADCQLMQRYVRQTLMFDMALSPRIFLPFRPGVTHFKKRRAQFVTGHGARQQTTSGAVLRPSLNVRTPIAVHVMERWKVSLLFGAYVGGPLSVWAPVERGDWLRAGGLLPHRCVVFSRGLYPFSTDC
jgi:hypothetical protein